MKEIAELNKKIKEMNLQKGEYIAIYGPQIGNVAHPVVFGKILEVRYDHKKDNIIVRIDDSEITRTYETNTISIYNDIFDIKRMNMDSSIALLNSFLERLIITFNRTKGSIEKQTKIIEKSTK